MQVSYEFFSNLFIFSDILPITDRLCNRRMSIQALGFKKKKKKNIKAIMESALSLHTTNVEVL